MNSRLLDYRPDLDFLDATPQLPARHGRSSDTDMRRATELLEVSGPAELERFLRGLMVQASRAGRAALDAPGAAALLAALKRAAQFTLPLSRTGGPLVDASGGGGIDAHARGARIFGLELEGLSPEDKEFELAQHFVRFATDAVRRADAVDAAGIGAAAGAASQAVQAALAQAARRHAPGLLRRAEAEGRWQRHADRITVHDC